MTILHFDLQLQFKYMNYFIYTSYQYNQDMLFKQEAELAVTRSTLQNSTRL